MKDEVTLRRVLDCVPFVSFGTINLSRKRML